MANEQKITIRYSVANGNYRHEINYGTVSVDQATAAGGTPGLLNSTTAASAISFGAVTPGYVFLRNLSTGNTVHFQNVGAIVFFELPPNAVSLVHKSTATTWYHRTASGTATIDIRGFST